VLFRPVLHALHPSTASTLAESRVRCLLVLQQTGKLVDELEHLRKHPRVVIVPMSSVQGDDVAAIKQMLYEKVCPDISHPPFDLRFRHLNSSLTFLRVMHCVVQSEGGRRVVIAEGQPTSVPQMHLQTLYV
jgi:hypothetical protein